MPLHERVGEIFLANEPAQARTDFSVSLARFLVPDIGTDRNGLRVVLLVESPHTHEICCGYPLAGVSGTRIRNALNRHYTERLHRRSLPNQPIGRLVHDENPNLLRLGIMNVSQLPFQGIAYRPFRNNACEYGCIPREENDCRDHPQWNNYTGHMNTIRKPAQTRRDPNRQTLDDAIVEDLRGRLSNLFEINPNAKLVICGEVAAAFYMKACGAYLPHPSRSNWQTLNQRQQQCLQDIVARLCRPASRRPVPE